MNKQLVFYGNTRWEDIMETSGFSTQSEIIVFGNLKSDTFVMTNGSLQVKGNMNVRNSVYVGDLEVEGDFEFRNLMESHGDVNCQGNLFAHGQMEVEGDLSVRGDIRRAKDTFNDSYCELRVDGDLSCNLAEVDKLYCHGKIIGAVKANEIYSNGVCENSNLISNEKQDLVDEFIGFRLGMTLLNPA